MPGSRIPDYPRFVPVALEHRDEVNEALAGTPGTVSEFSFSNLYLFRKAHDYRICRWKGLLLIKARSYEGKEYGFPPWGEGPHRSTRPSAVA